LTRLQCPGGDANELAKMNAKEYEKQLSENLAITEMPIVLSNLLAKKRFSLKSNKILKQFAESKLKIQVLATLLKQKQLQNRKLQSNCR
jgi:hypothetical protein